MGSNYSWEVMPLRGREFGLRLVVIRSGHHPRAGAFPAGRVPRQEEVMGEIAGFFAGLWL
jgi:hypothetical protein